MLRFFKAMSMRCLGTPDVQYCREYGTVYAEHTVVICCNVVLIHRKHATINIQMNMQENNSMNKMFWLIFPLVILNGCATKPAADLDLSALEGRITETKAGDFGSFMVSMHKAEDQLDTAERIHADLALGRASSTSVVKEGLIAADLALSHRNDAEDAFDRLLLPLETSVEENNQMVEESIARLEWLERLHLRADTPIPLKSIYFDFGGHRVKPNEAKKITDLIDFLREHPVFALKVTGYADTVGSKQRNLRLAERRNNAVLNALQQQGLPGNTIVTVAIGEAEGPDETRNPDNRRVEIKPYIHGRYAYPKAAPAPSERTTVDSDDFTTENFSSMSK